ncbi:MAG: acylneuraminate cytidylyltransferase family protein [Alphaproteobacteria bacterium]
MNIGIILARGDSKSIKLKNIIKLNDKPLLFYSLNALNKSNKIDKIILSTDHKKIKDFALSLNYSKLKIFDRNKINARDSASSESALNELFEYYNFQDSYNIIFVQATSPLITATDLNIALKSFDNNNYDSLFSGVRLKRFIWNNNIKPINYDFRKRPRRQEFKGIIVENGAFYIFRSKNYKHYKNRLHGKIGFHEMSPENFHELDEKIDLEIIKSIIKFKKK